MCVEIMYNIDNIMECMTRIDSLKGKERGGQRERETGRQRQSDSMSFSKNSLPVCLCQ